MTSSLYLLDTNIVSYSIKGSYPKVWSALRTKHANQLAISVITEAELRFWIFDKPEETRVRTLVNEFLDRVPSLPWESAATHIYADLRATSKRDGKAFGPLDMLIASHAIAIGATLVTHDRAFSQIPGLKTEDWV